MAANEKGADLVVIGVVNLNSPTCFISKKNKRIRNPKDFEGKRVGILAGTNTEYVYRALVKKMGLNTKSIKEIDVPFDLGSFLADAYDVRPAFIYDEPVSLDEKKIEYDIIEPKNYGISFLGTVYVTRRKTINENRETVQMFVNSVADGWKAAIKYPERAIDYLKKYDPNISQKRELESLKKALPYFQGKEGKILFAGMEDWSGMVRSLQDLGILKNVDLVKSIDNSFLEYYYRTHQK